MTPNDFIHWLRGFMDLSPTPPDADQWEIIREKVKGVGTPESPMQLFNEAQHCLGNGVVLTKGTSDPNKSVGLVQDAIRSIDEQLSRVPRDGAYGSKRWGTCVKTGLPIDMDEQP